MKKNPRKKLSTDLLLPEPMELAKLAAILAPNGQPAAALERAMQFYVEAVNFSHELPVEFDEWVMRFGKEERRSALMAQPLEVAIEDSWMDTLRLDPNAGDDPARKFLDEHGLKLKRSRAVIDNIRRYCEERPRTDFRAGEMPSADSILDRCKRMDGGREIYEIPKFLLKSVAAAGRFRRSQAKRKGHRTRKALQVPQSADKQPPADAVK